MPAKKTPGKRPGKKPGKRAAKKKATRKKATRKKTAGKVVKPPSARRQKKPYAESEVARVRVPDATESRDALRFHAGKDYVYDPHQNTARWWWEAHYQSVPWNTFRKWVQEDDWTSRREDHWRTVEAALGRKIASDVVREQAKEVEDLSKLRTQAFGFLFPTDPDDKTIPAPKSYESVAKVALDIDKRLDEKRAIVVDQLPLALGSQSTEAAMAGPGVTYSDEELRAMAQARMRVQQKRLEAEIVSDTESVEKGEEG